MPVLKLRKHQATFSDEDILINPSDYSELKIFDVVELKQPNHSSTNNGAAVDNRILLQVRRWPDNSSHVHPSSVSIKDTVVNAHLKLYSDVLVRIVNKKDVVVDSIEVCFSNAYLARSYMWGLRNHLNNRCVYERQKLDYLHIRSQICEIWAHGNRVSSGYVDDDTKIVFRSASSLVYLFIQMSSEMWDYDINGDLYGEKAINGFLTDLFETWRKNECSHDITIVLFSRTFYDAQSLDEFPEEMRECLQVDYKGRFYEDCYRVAFQNDRFDLHDWVVKLTTLKSLFNQYQKEVIDRHQDKYPNVTVPRAFNSSASQGNFLEVLNMSLNVFEKHYFDRSFDRTGQLSVVVSPGVGVFEVDFEMTNLTKQRIIDNGIGSDLVCLGEQPLHTVPLLKFNSKTSHSDDRLASCDVYNMPHWINLSFYSSPSQDYYSNFVPRIKLPTIHYPKIVGHAQQQHQQHQSHHQQQPKLAQASSRLTGNGQMSAGLGPDKSLIGHHSESTGTMMSADDSSQQQPPPPPQQRQAPPRPVVASAMAAKHANMPDLVDYDDYDAQVFKSGSNMLSPLSYQSSRPLDRCALSYLNSNVASEAMHDVHGSAANGASVGGAKTSYRYEYEYDYDCNYDNDYEYDYEYDQHRRRHPNHDGHHHNFDHGRAFPGKHKAASIQRRSSDVKNYQEYNRAYLKRRQLSENMPIGARASAGLNVHNTFTRMSLVDSYLAELGNNIKPESADDLSVRGYNAHASRLSRTNPGRPKALINPFDPSHMTIKLTPNRRRWTHVFPQGPTGTFMQQHHCQPVAAARGAKPYLAAEVSCNSARCFPNLAGSGPQNKASSGLAMSALSPAATVSAPEHNKTTLVSNDTIRFAWCASGEQEWTPATTTGVDWKSLTMPACLPLTTDFFPSKTSLQNDYVIGEYTIDSSCIHSRYSLLEVYRELVCQRLQKGFQIILLPGKQQPGGSPATVGGLASQASDLFQQRQQLASSGQLLPGSRQPQQQQVESRVASSGNSTSGHRTGRHRTPTSSSSSVASLAIKLGPSPANEPERAEYTMSIGRIFHKLSLDGNTITITQYRPRHPYPTIKIDYCYRFRAPFHDTYGESWVHFKSEKLENYSWNYLDNYICARGESFELRSNLKFWRFRILVLPSAPSLRKLSPGATSGGGEADSQQQQQQQTRHDVFGLRYASDERAALVESFAKLLEIINKTRRASASRLSSSSSSCAVGAPSAAGAAAGAPVAAETGAPSTLNVHIGRVSRQPPQAAELPLELASATDDAAISGEQAAAAHCEPAACPPPPDTSDTPTIKPRFESINMDIDTALRDARRAEWVHVQYHNLFHVEQAFELVIKWMVASGAGIAEMVQGWSRKAGGHSSVHLVPIPWEPFAMPHSGKADPLRCPIVVPLRLDSVEGGCQLDERQAISLQERILRRFGFVAFHDLVSSDDKLERQFVHMSGFAFVALADASGASAAPAAAHDNQRPKQPSPRLAPPATAAAASAQGPQLVDERASPAKWAARQLAPLQAPAAAAAAAATPPATHLKLDLEAGEALASPHEEYITRHIGGARLPDRAAGRKPREAGRQHLGFIWSWNYMLTKRWRSPATQDESYAVSLMQDFRDFCNNSDQRLARFCAELANDLATAMAAQDA